MAVRIRRGPDSPAQRSLPGGFQVGDRGVDDGRAVEPQDRRAGRVRRGRAGPRPTSPSRPRGRPPKRSARAAKCSGGTSSRNRVGDSENSRTASCAASSSQGTSRSETVAPRPPASAISARATARPPSLRSWQLRTSPRADRRVDRPEERPAQLGIDPGHPAPVAAPGSRPRASRPAQPGHARRAASRLPGSLRSIVTQRRTSGTWPMALIRSVGGDGQALAVVGVLVVQAVLARDERRAVGQGQVVARLRGQDQRAERLGALGVAPAEVVEQRDPPGIGADGHAVADGLVDDAGRPSRRGRAGRSAG